MDLYDSYIKGEKIFFIFCIDDIYFTWACSLKKLSKDINFNKELVYPVNDDLFLEYINSTNFLEKFNDCLDGAITSTKKEAFFHGPFMKRAENYFAALRLGSKEKAYVMFHNVLNRTLAMVIAIPPEFYDLPADDQRIQHLLQSALEEIDTPLFDIPEIKNNKIK